MRSEESLVRRTKALEAVGYNLDLLSEEFVDQDFLTDSLMHRHFPISRVECATQRDTKYLDLEIQKYFRNYFGFQHVIAVSQGRLAEAILNKAVVRNGHYIPGSALFSTTRIHQERNGATPVEVMIPESLDASRCHPFKGNIDLESLDRAIQTYHAGWIPYICVEPCNNAVGGHPVSMENIRGVRTVADKYGIPVYLDASRIIDNAFLIQERESKYRDAILWDIILEFCSYADGCTMSATKDFPTPIGGFLAMRDANLFARCVDDFILLGSGLSNLDKAILVESMRNPDDVFFHVNERMQRVKKLHQALEGKYALSHPTGGHALFIDGSALKLGLPIQLNPQKAFLNHLFVTHGIRGSVNPQSLSQMENDISLVRFALPILGMKADSIDSVARNLLCVLGSGELIRGLEKITQPPGITGILMAQYRLVAEGIA